MNEEEIKEIIRDIHLNYGGTVMRRELKIWKDAQIIILNNLKKVFVTNSNYDHDKIMFQIDKLIDKIEKWK